MVVSKRCKICTVLDPDNIPISGEYFGKLLPELIVKISGIELDPRKANGVLICQSCALQLVHIGSVVDKLRNTLQRLKKLETKSRTPAKSSASSKTTEGKDSEKGEDGEINHQTNTIESKTPKKVVRRKSVFPDDTFTKNGEDKQNEEENKSETSEIGLPEEQESKPSKAVKELDVQSNLESEEISENKQKSKSPKKVVRRKSVFPDDKTIIIGEADVKGEDKQETSEETSLANSELDNINSQVNLNGSKTKKPAKSLTPKKVVKPKKDDNQNNHTNNENESSEETPSALVVNKKFKKMLDDEVKTPAKKTPTKRKQTTSNDVSLKTTESISSPMKRTKTQSISINEESFIDGTVDENDSVAESKVKVLNCIICGKAFQQKSALRDHIETSHMGERLKSCPHCSSEFRSQQKYESHVFSEKCKNTNHACQYPKCNKRFKTVHKMEMHMHEKHSSQNEYDDE